MPELGTYAVSMCGDNEDWSLRGMTLDGAEPELQAWVLEALTRRPDEQVDSTVGQEELEQQKGTVRSFTSRNEWTRRIDLAK